MKAENSTCSVSLSNLRATCPQSPSAQFSVVESPMLTKLTEFLKVQTLLGDSLHFAQALEAGCATFGTMFGFTSVVAALGFADEMRVVASWGSSERRASFSEPWLIPFDQSIAYQAMVRCEMIEWETVPLPALAAQLKLDEEFAVPRRYYENAMKSRSAAIPFVGSKGEGYGALVFNTGRQDDLAEEEILLGNLVAHALAGAIEGNRRWIDALDRKDLVSQEMLAQLLHDTIAQDAFALELSLDALAMSVEGIPEADLPLSEAHAACARIQENVRGLILPENAIVNGSHDDLKGAILRVVDEAERHCGMRFVPFVSTVAAKAVTPEVKTALLAIVREALSNAEKHARAKAGFIRITQVDRHIVLVVQNDGVEARTGDLTQGSGMRFGLRNLAAMAEKLGGIISYAKSEEEETFTVRACFPLEGEGA